MGPSKALHKCVINLYQHQKQDDYPENMRLAHFYI